MRKEQKNKGFSLVELIVVVAIMGVLMVVLAPSLLKYVESSRLQSDNSGVGEIANSIKIALTDEDVYNSMVYTGAGANNVLTFTVNATTGVQSISFAAPGGTDDRSELVKELNDILGPGFETSSNTYKGASAITITISNTGTITATNYISEVNGTAGSKVF